MIFRNFRRLIHYFFHVSIFFVRRNRRFATSSNSYNVDKYNFRNLLVKGSRACRTKVTWVRINSTLRVNLFLYIRVFLDANSDNKECRVSGAINIFVGRTSAFFANFQDSRRSSSRVLFLNCKAVFLRVVFRERIKSGRSISSHLPTNTTRVLRSVLRSKVRVSRRRRQGLCFFASVFRLIRGRLRYRTIFRNTNNDILSGKAIDRQIAREGTSFGRIGPFFFRSFSNTYHAFWNEGTYAGVGE